jgi:hypothetical protein
MAHYESDFGVYNSSDSGVFLLDPQERALLRACADKQAREDEEAEAHRRFLEIARDLPPVRLEKVLAIRRQIAEGSYLTKDKLESTIDRLLERLG